MCMLRASNIDHASVALCRPGPHIRCPCQLLPATDSQRRTQVVNRCTCTDTDARCNSLVGSCHGLARGCNGLACGCNSLVGSCHGLARSCNGLAGGCNSLAGGHAAACSVSTHCIHTSVELGLAMRSIHAGLARQVQVVLRRLPQPGERAVARRVVGVGWRLTHLLQRRAHQTELHAVRQGPRDQDEAGAAG
eukprot:353422-Chlamydomonas_euryale.AAC.3